MKKIFLISLLSVLSLNFFAQGVKLGHINTQELLAVLPDKIAAEEELQRYAAQLEEYQQNIQNDLNKKYEEYLTERESYNDLVKATKENELQNLQQQLATYNKSAQQDLAQKEQDLLQPIIQKLQTAIDEIGKENNFLYIFDTSSGNLLYKSAESVDITPLVRKKLGLED